MVKKHQEILHSLMSFAIRLLKNINITILVRVIYSCDVKKSIATHYVIHCSFNNAIAIKLLSLLSKYTPLIPTLDVYIQDRTVNMAIASLSHSVFQKNKKKGRLTYCFNDLTLLTPTAITIKSMCTLNTVA